MHFSTESPMLWSIRVRGLALDCDLQIRVSNSFNKLACGFSKGWNPAEISQKVCHSVNYEFSIDNLSPKPYTLETLNFLQVLPADAVVVGAGVLPNTRFVEGLSLDGLLIFRKFRDMHLSKCKIL